MGRRDPGTMGAVDQGPAITTGPPFQVLRQSGPFSQLDEHRAWRPSVLAAPNGTLGMWYGGHDGTTPRILAAEQRPGHSWVRRGAVIEPGFAGRSDAAGVAAPSIVRTSTGYLLAYIGSDGRTDRIHFATSSDGQRWQPQGSLPAAGGHDQAAPCLVAGPATLWLYYAGTGGGGESSLFAATSADGATWRDAELVMRGNPGEALSQPWVVALPSTLLMLFVATTDGVHTVIGTSTSSDGRAWTRRQALDLGRKHHDTGAIDGPTAVSTGARAFSLWYAAGPAGDETSARRLYVTEVRGLPAWPTTAGVQPESGADELHDQDEVTGAGGDDEGVPHLVVAEDLRPRVGAAGGEDHRSDRVEQAAGDE